MKNLSPKLVHDKLQDSKERVCFVDVRSVDEFRSGHVPGAVCVPLDQIESGTALLPSDRLVILSCLGGKRSARAAEILRGKGFGNITEMEGGFQAWAKEGLPVNRNRRSFTIIRQVMLTAGSLILTGTLLGIFVNRGFFTVPLVVGTGLSFAGVTGWCGMAFLLERMPWNRTSEP